MKILVLGGGGSNEREVSLRSAAAVQAALVVLGHDVVFVDPQDGDWAAVARAARQCGLVLPILHGAGGEDGQVQLVLDETGVPYLGAGAAASALCFAKPRLKAVLERHGIATPAGEVVTAATLGRSAWTRAPFVLKPVAGGSSVGMMVARALPYDEARARGLLAEQGEMLLEELVEGVEITVPVLGEAALPVIEVVPPAGEEFDYDNKYNGATAELCPPEHVAEETQRAAQALAARVHGLAGARHLSRTDMIARPDGQIMVLELNTMPGLTDQSLFPKAAGVAGLGWNELVARLVELALTLK